MAADHRKTWALGTDDRIVCADTTYIITGDPIGYGGSAIVYPARSTDDQLHYAIKECFPRNGDYRRERGVIRPMDPDSARLLEHFRSELETEKRTGQLIHNTGSRAVCIRKLLHPTAITFRGKTTEQPAAGGFALLDRMDLKSRSLFGLLADLRESYTPEELDRTRGLPHIHTTACLMEEILLALQQVHATRDPEDPSVGGYYYCDLHGGNIHFTDSQICDGTVGTAHLIDFGSARKLDHNGLTEELRSGQICIAPEICPPEICPGGVFRLGRDSDLFSLGCLMLQCVATPERLESCVMNYTAGTDFLSVSEGAYIGCGPELLKLVNDILDHATAKDRRERYRSSGQMLLQIRELKARSAPPPRNLLLGFSTLPEGAFVGRTGDRRALDRYLDSRINPIILHGFPGMGKTELAIDYGRYRSRFSRVYFVRFSGSFRDTVIGPIADAFTGYSKTLPDGRPKPEALILQETLQMLGQCPADDILIIDAVDRRSGSFADLRTEEYRQLCALPMHLLLTTRFEPDGEGQWHPVGPLSQPDLCRLMRRHVPGVPDEQLLPLITEVQSHTLTLDLLARTMARSHWSVNADSLLRTLRGAAASDTLPEISTTHNRSSRTARLHEHLRALFDLSGMTADGLAVLRCATLLSSEGMDAPLFKRCLQSKEQAAMEQLVQTGWLTVSQQHLLRIHPVIREVCKAELRPDLQHCGPFLQQLWLLRSAADAPLPTLQMADCFAAAAKLPGSSDPQLASRAEILYREAGQYGKSLEYAQLALEIGRQVLPETDPRLAVLYCNLGSAFGDAGQYDRELECQEAALMIRLRVLPQNHPELAESYSSLGTAYGDNADASRELQYQQKALQIRQNILPPDHPDLADSCDKVGCALCAVGEYEQSEKYLRRALRIRSASLSADRLLLADSHNNLGRTLLARKQYTQALEQFRIALELRKAMLPPWHPILADAHSNLAWVYSLMWNPRREMEHYLAAFRIRRELLGTDNPELLGACLDTAKACVKCGDHRSAASYYRHALQLQSRDLPEDHPSLGESYHQLALSCQAIGQREAYLHYLQKGARARHSRSMCELGTLLYKSGNAQGAVHWFELAARQGSGAAACSLGYCLLTGTGCQRDLNRGMQLLTEAAALDIRAAHRHLGHIYMGRYDTLRESFPPDPRKALFHLRRARALGATQDGELIRQAEDMLHRTL